MFYSPGLFIRDRVSFISHDGYLVTFSLRKDLKNGKMPNLLALLGKE